MAALPGGTTRARRARTAAPHRMMRAIDLREYARSEPVQLSVAQRDSLTRIERSLTVEPAPGAEDEYYLTPGSVIGAFESGGLSVSIRPKLAIDRVLFLASYAMGAFKLRDMDRFDYADARTLVEAMALALAAAVRRAFAGGLIHGYRTVEEAAHTVRGRIRIDEQIRRRFGVPVPIEVRYDEFTDDVTANRLVKAAAARLGRLRLSLKHSREGLHWIAARLENVSLVEFPATAVPEVAFDRLNEHYRDVVALARLVLRHGSFEAARGGVRAQGFLIDMNDGYSRTSLPKRFASRSGCRLTCSAPTRPSSRPSLTKQDASGSSPTSPGGNPEPAPLSATPSTSGSSMTASPNADLYQLLAYATALDLPGGLLIYAEGEGGAGTRTWFDMPANGWKSPRSICREVLHNYVARIDGLSERVRALRIGAGGNLRVA